LVQQVSASNVAAARNTTTACATGVRRELIQGSAFRIRVLFCHDQQASMYLGNKRYVTLLKFS
jgi:hypothetical protein